jgi:hypothetical protein
VKKRIFGLVAALLMIATVALSGASPASAASESKALVPQSQFLTSCPAPGVHITVRPGDTLYSLCMELCGYFPCDLVPQ